MSEITKNEHVAPMIITDPDTGREYTLEYNRKSVVKVEQAGFDVNGIGATSMTMIPLMFWGAFLMHHPHMTKEQTDKILFDGLHGLDEDELAYLGKLYAEPLKTLVSSKEDSDGNPRRMAVKF